MKKRQQRTLRLGMDGGLNICDDPFATDDNEASNMQNSASNSTPEGLRSSSKEIRSKKKKMDKKKVRHSVQVDHSVKSGK